MDMQRLELKKLINSENGVNYHKNIDLSGYVFYKGDSFIAFKLAEINGVTVVKIEYIYITSKKDLVQLFSYCTNFWKGNNAKYIYFKEHRRHSNVAEKTLSAMGFNLENVCFTNWKHQWTSTNGYPEYDVMEAHT